MTWTDTAGSGQTKSYNKTLSENLDVTIGQSAKGSVEGIGGVKEEWHLHVNFHNSNSWGGSETEEDTNSESKGIYIHVPEGTGADKAYAFKSAVYVSSGGGPFKVAHAVDPVGSDLGEGWWRSQYGRRPDPALNLPNRFEWNFNKEDVTGYWTLAEEKTRKQMRGFFLRKNQPDPVSGAYELLGETLTDGDKVRLCARVYNFSLSQPSGDFDVQFEYVVFDNEMNEEVGERVLIDTTRINLAPLEMKEAQVVWDTKGLSNTLVDGKACNHYRFYVTVDPENEVTPEIHEWKDAKGNKLAHGNNEGYWPWSGAVVVAVNEDQAAAAQSPLGVSMDTASLGVKTSSGIETDDIVFLELNKRYALRTHIRSDDRRPHYRMAFFYDTTTQGGQRLIASEVVHGLSGEDTYVWTEWKTPREAGAHELLVSVHEDSDDGNPGDATDSLAVFVYDPNAKGDKGPCFIATAAYGSPMAPRVSLLRWSRSLSLLTDRMGRSLVNFYHTILARWARSVPAAKGETSWWTQPCS